MENKDKCLVCRALNLNCKRTPRTGNFCPTASEWTKKDISSFMAKETKETKEKIIKEMGENNEKR